MPRYEITGPDGTQYWTEGPEGSTRDDALRMAPQLLEAGKLHKIEEPAEEGGLKGVLAMHKEALSNLPSSVMKFGREIAPEAKYLATAGPYRTMWDVLMHHDKYVDAMKDVDWKNLPKELPKEVWNEFLSKYGSGEKIEQMYRKDPFNFMLDWTMAGEGGRLGLRALSKIPARFTRKQLPEIVSIPAHVHAEHLERAGEAGLAGGERSARFKAAQSSEIPEAAPAGKTAEELLAQSPGAIKKAARRAGVTVEEWAQRAGAASQAAVGGAAAPEAEAGRALSPMVRGGEIEHRPIASVGSAFRRGAGHLIEAFGHPAAHAGAGAATHFGFPHGFAVTIPALAARSPRLMGSMMHGLGAMERKAGEAAMEIPAHLGRGVFYGGHVLDRQQTEDASKDAIKDKEFKGSLTSSQLKLLRRVSRGGAKSHELTAAQEIIKRWPAFSVRTTREAPYGGTSGDIPTRQEGGPVDPKQTYMVGEPPGQPAVGKYTIPETEKPPPGGRFEASQFEPSTYAPEARHPINMLWDMLVAGDPRITPRKLKETIMGSGPSRQVMGAAATKLGPKIGKVAEKAAARAGLNLPFGAKMSPLTDVAMLAATKLPHQLERDVARGAPARTRLQNILSGNIPPQWDVFR